MACSRLDSGAARGPVARRNASQRSPRPAKSHQRARSAGSPKGQRHGVPGPRSPISARDPLAHREGSATESPARGVPSPREIRWLTERAAQRSPRLAESRQRARSAGSPKGQRNGVPGPLHPFRSGERRHSGNPEEDSSTRAASEEEARSVGRWLASALIGGRWAEHRSDSSPADASSLARLRGIVGA